MTVLLRTIALMAIASGHPGEIEQQLIDALAALRRRTPKPAPRSNRKASFGRSRSEMKQSVCWNGS